MSTNNKQNLDKLSQFPVNEKLVKAEFITVNNCVNGCLLTFESGKFVELFNEYGSKIYTNAEPRMQDAWEVKGKLFDVDLTKHFNEKSTAERYKEKLEDTSGVEGIELNKIRVPEAEELVQSEEIPF